MTRDQAWAAVTRPVPAVMSTFCGAWDDRVQQFLLAEYGLMLRHYGTAGYRAWSVIGPIVNRDTSYHTGSNIFGTGYNEL